MWEVRYAMFIATFTDYTCQTTVMFGIMKDGLASLQKPLSKWRQRYAKYG